MREINQAVGLIHEHIQDIKDDAFENVSTGNDSHLRYVQLTGRVRGLLEAIDILLGVVNGDRDE